MKRNLFYFLISAMIFVNFTVAKADECLENVRFFINPEAKILKITDRGSIEKNIEKFYIFSRRAVYPSRSVSRPDVYGENVIDTYYSKHFSHMIEIHSFNESPGMDSHIQNGFYQDYLKQVEENIDYVLSVYEKRRDWSKDFLKDVREQALHDADRTQYIVVKKYEDIKKEEIWGTLKVVRSRENNSYEELLPTETAMGIKLPFNNGFKFEPGNFAVDKNHYKDGMAQLLLHLSRLVKKEMKDYPQINPTEDLFYTYADRESKLMYTSLGFKVTKGFESSFKKDGKDWWILSISGQDLADLPTRLKQSRNSWSDSDQEVFNEVVSLFDSMSVEPLVDRNLLTNSIQSPLSKKPGMVVLSQSEPHLYRGEEVQKLGIVFDHFPDNGSWNLPVLTKNIPLQEGKELLSEYNGIKAIYRDGKVIFDYAVSDETAHYELTIDPYLKEPTYLSFQKKRDDIVQISFEAFFSGHL